VSSNYDVIGDPDSETLVKTAAFLVLAKKYKSIADAKAVYESALIDSKKVFGDDPDSKNLVKTAACFMLTGKYKSIAEAKAAFDKGELY